MLVPVTSHSPEQSTLARLIARNLEGPQAAIEELSRLQGRTIKGPIPHWDLMVGLVDDISVTEIGGELRVRVGPAEAAAVLTGRRESFERGRFDELRCALCRRAPCAHQWAVGLHWLAMQEGPNGGGSASDVAAVGPWFPALRGTSDGDNEESPLRFQLQRKPDKPSGLVEVAYLPASGRTGRPLGLRPAPKGGDALIRKVGSIPRGDWAAVRRLEQLRHFERLQRGQGASAKWVGQELRATLVELVVALSEVTYLEFEGQPVSVSEVPWDGAVQKFFDPSAGLTLEWAEPPLAVYHFGGGLVVDASNTLRPVPPHLRTVLGRIPVEGACFIPLAQVSTWIEEQAALGGVEQPATQVEFEKDIGLPNIDFIAPPKRARRRPEVIFLYDARRVRWHEPEVLLTPDSQAHPKLLARDLTGERALVGDLIKAHFPRVFTERNYRSMGPSSADLMAENRDLGAQEEGTEPRRPVIPTAIVNVGVDGIELELGFRSDHYPVPPSRILDAWAGRRSTLRRLDGHLMELPAQWLGRHGDFLADYLALDTEYSGRMPHTVLPLIPEAIQPPESTALPVDLSEYRRLVERPAEVPPDAFVGTLRVYQQVGYGWLHRLWRLGLGGLLADDMGLGKTVQAAALFAGIHGADESALCLVVTPTSVMKNWANELGRFAPAAPVTFFHGKQRRVPAKGVVITTYHMLREHSRTLTRKDWSVVLLDEAQAIKNPGSQTARAARRLKAKARFALTGTPFENNLEELWSVMEFILPGFFGRLTQFKKRYAKASGHPGSAKGRHLLGHLKRRVGPYLLRRVKDEVVDELPGRKVHQVWCELDEEQRGHYREVERRYRRSVAYRISQVGVKRAKFVILEALTRLRQAACDPGLISNVEGTRSAKRERLKQLLQEAVPAGRRFLVFSQWPSLLKRVIPDLRELGYSYLYLDGQTKDRDVLQAAWNEPSGPPVFLISLKAGGAGMNLTGADTVVHLDPWWNPAVEAQAMDRCYRIGQTREVEVYKLIARDTLEERVVRTQTRKQALFDSFFGDLDEVTTSLELSDIELLFGDSLEGADGPVAGLREAGVAVVDDEGLPPVLHDLLTSQGKLTNHSVRTALGCSADVARRRLKKWAKQGLLIRRGRRQNTRYLPG